MKSKQKNQNIKSFKALGGLFKYGKSYAIYFVIALILATAGTVFTLFGPNKIGEITDIMSSGLILGSIDMTAIWNIAIFLIVIYSAGGIFSYFEGFIMAKVSVGLSQKMRKDISDKINKVPLKYYDKTTYGNILSRLTNDVDVVGQSINNSITTLVASVALFLGSLLMMFITNWIMAFTALGSTLIGFALMGLIMSKSQKHFIAQQQGLGELNGHIEEAYSNQSLIRAYNGIEESTAKFNTYNSNLYNSAWKSQFMSGLMMPLMHFIGNFGYLAVCVVGVILTINGNAGIGTIVSFMIYIRLFTQPLSQIAQCFTSLQSASAGAERIFDFLGEENLADESDKTTYLNPSQVKGTVEFKNVQFGYNENKIIIKNFSAKVKAGQKVAIVGPTGAGKTTLINLLMRFYEVNSGQILIDGIDTKTLTRENVHDLFSMVLQDTWIHEASVIDNIKYSKTEISDEAVFEACKICGVEHFIKTLPEGYNTILTESASISAGQKQLLTIARAMVQNSPMLILDEATSSVDTRTEQMIQKAMDKLTENKTSFVIAHRLSTIRNADLILVLKDGDIIEQGDHKTLLAQNGFYSELYNSQFEE
ncbi:MAG: ABC transporter ATP-binding protein [Clostridia bacterium]|nr:ABC transporter ATP-binding protein [Clostridia bacterium]